MDTVSIRPVTLDDLPVLIRHRRGLFRNSGGSDEGVLNQVDAASVTYLTEAMLAGTYYAWMAMVGDRAVASVGIHFVGWVPGYDDPGPRRAWVNGVYTEPEFRRRGMARRLMEFTVAWCREAGCRTVLLHATDQGRPLYESMGFRASNELKLEL